MWLILRDLMPRCVSLWLLSVVLRAGARGKALVGGPKGHGHRVRVPGAGQGQGKGRRWTGEAATHALRRDPGGTTEVETTSVDADPTLSAPAETAGATARRRSRSASCSCPTVPSPPSSSPTRCSARRVRGCASATSWSGRDCSTKRPRSCLGRAVGSTARRPPTQRTVARSAHGGPRVDRAGPHGRANAARVRRRPRGCGRRSGTSGSGRGAQQASGMRVHLRLAPASDIRRTIDQSSSRSRASRSTSATSRSRPAPAAAARRTELQEAVGGQCAGGAGGQPDHHAGAARPGVRHAHRAAGRRRSGCASASTARCTTCSTLPADDGPGGRQPHQDHGGDEHRRAAAPARRPDRDQRSTGAALDIRVATTASDPRREDRAAAARQEPVAAAAGGARHAAGDTTRCSPGWCASPFGMVICAGPDRQRQDHHPVRHRSARSTRSSATS